MHTSMRPSFNNEVPEEEKRADGDDRQGTDEEQAEAEETNPGGGDFVAEQTLIDERGHKNPTTTACPTLRSK